MELPLDLLLLNSMRLQFTELCTTFGRCVPSTVVLSWQCRNTGDLIREYRFPLLALLLMRVNQVHKFLSRISGGNDNQVPRK